MIEENSKMEKIIIYTGRHIKNIIKTGELIQEGNVQKMHIRNSDKPISYFSLGMILSVGYQVNSMRGTQFCIWANRVLKDTMLKIIIILNRSQL